MYSDNEYEYEYLYEYELSADERAERFNRDLQRVRDNDPSLTELHWNDDLREQHILNITNEEWEEIGRDVCNNTHLKELFIKPRALDDDKMSFLCRGLTGSTSLKVLSLGGIGLSAAGVMSMDPFLQNAINLQSLYLHGNSIQSEGFNLLLRALRHSSIELLQCNNCGIESIQIDTDCIPRQLKTLWLDDNNINTDGCRGLAKLLHGEDSTLKHLHLDDNKIGDEGVAILVDSLRKNSSLEHLHLERNVIDDEGVAVLVDALRNNTSLTTLHLRSNWITEEGQVMILKLLNDVSSIKTTLQSNHTLRDVKVLIDTFYWRDEIGEHVQTATAINSKNESNPEAAGREKVIQTQLHSGRREKLAKLQEVNHSLYSEINPLHLPEVLSLVGNRNGHEELYVSLKSSIVELISTMNRKECIKQQRDFYLEKASYYAGIVEELDAELVEIDAAEGSYESRAKKRRRKWWWGFWNGE